MLEESIIKSLTLSDVDVIKHEAKAMEQFWEERQSHYKETDEKLLDEYFAEWQKWRQISDQATKEIRDRINSFISKDL